MIKILNWYAITQISTSVQQAMEVVVLELPAKTPLAALRVPGYVPQDTPVTERIVWVSQINYNNINNL